jgi:transcriptional regulator with XRE-family HTH domain
VRRVFVRHKLLQLELARRQLGLPQVRVSEATGIHQRFISQMETGQIWPTPDQRQRLAALLKIPPDILMEPVELPVVEQPRLEKSVGVGA